MKLEGLIADELNGVFGVVERLCRESDRYNVRLLQEHGRNRSRVIAVRSKNIVTLTEDRHSDLDNGHLSREVGVGVFSSPIESPTRIAIPDGQHYVDNAGIILAPCIISGVSSTCTSEGFNDARSCISMPCLFLVQKLSLRLKTLHSLQVLLMQSIV